MSQTDEIKNGLKDEWIPRIYAEKVRPQRTRSFEMDIAGRENKPEILHTLLGIDLKVGTRGLPAPLLEHPLFLRFFPGTADATLPLPYKINKS